MFGASCARPMRIGVRRSRYPKTAEAMLARGTQRRVRRRILFSWGAELWAAPETSTLKLAGGLGTFWFYLAAMHVACASVKTGTAATSRP